MKKCLPLTKIIIVMILIITSNNYLFAQSGQKFATDGNILGGTDFIGSTNAYPLVVKTNNVEQFRLTALGYLGLGISNPVFKLDVNGRFHLTGNSFMDSSLTVLQNITSNSVKVNTLANNGNKLVIADNTGLLTTFPFGQPNEVLYGNGIWGVLPPQTQWGQNGNNIFYDHGYVGVGTANPLYDLDVTGDVRITNNLYVGGGIVITEKVQANVKVNTASLEADSIIMDSTKAFYGYSKFEGDVRLKNKLDVTGNSFFNGNIDVNGTLRCNGTNGTTANIVAPIIKTSRIAPMDGDSIVRIGDSTLIFQTNSNRIVTSSKGLALGLGTYANGEGSLSIGRVAYTSATGSNSIIIGTGFYNGNWTPFINNKPNSIMLGTNSTVPTLFISSSPGPSNNTTGNVGIGTTTPSQKLEIAHNDATGGIVLNHISGTSSKSEIKFNKGVTELWAIGNDFDNNGTQTFYIWNNASTSAPLLINQNGQVGIGGVIPTLSNLGYKLYVDGGIVARDVKVTSGPFPDYVFASNYKFMTIYELENYLKLNNHHPNFPSAAEIEKNKGFELGDMQVKLVKTIEEQTLYIIDLQKQIDELKQLIKNK